MTVLGMWWHAAEAPAGANAVGSQTYNAILPGLTGMIGAPEV